MPRKRKSESPARQAKAKAKAKATAKTRTRVKSVSLSDMFGSQALAEIQTGSPSTGVSEPPPQKVGEVIVAEKPVEPAGEPEKPAEPAGEPIVTEKPAEPASPPQDVEMEGVKEKCAEPGGEPIATEKPAEPASSPPQDVEMEAVKEKPAEPAGEPIVTEKPADPASPPQDVETEEVKEKPAEPAGEPIVTASPPQDVEMEEVKAEKAAGETAVVTKPPWIELRRGPNRISVHNVCVVVSQMPGHRMDNVNKIVGQLDFQEVDALVSECREHESMAQHLIDMKRTVKFAEFNPVHDLKFFIDWWAPRLMSRLEADDIKIKEKIFGVPGGGSALEQQAQHAADMHNIDVDETDTADIDSVQDCRHVFN